MTRLFYYAFPVVLAALVVLLAIVALFRGATYRRELPALRDKHTGASTESGQVTENIQKRLAELQVVSTYDRAGNEMTLHSEEPAIASVRMLPYVVLVGWQQQVNRIIEGYLATAAKSPDLNPEAIESLRKQLAETVTGANSESAHARRLSLELAKICDRLGAVQTKMVMRQEAKQLLGSLAQAFVGSQYHDVISTANRLLVEYRTVLLPTERDHIILVRDKSIFRKDLADLDRSLRNTKKKEEQCLILDKFLNRYAKAERLTQEMWDAIVEREQRLAIAKRIVLEKKDAASASYRIEQLTANQEPSFIDSLRQAEAILSEYPSAQSRRIVQNYCRYNLSRFLARKQSELPQGLQEFEYRLTEDGPPQVVAGFVKEVHDLQGNVVGYKVYQKREDRNDPRFDVGTYRSEKVLSPPSPSVPETCVARYNQERNEFLSRLQSTRSLNEFRSLCLDLTTTCSELTREAQDYSRKPGAITVQVSFSHEADFARELADESIWRIWQKIFSDRDD